MEQTTRPISPAFKDWAKNNWVGLLVILVALMILFDDFFKLGGFFCFILYLSFVFYLKYNRAEIYLYFKKKLFINTFILLYFFVRLLVDNFGDISSTILKNKEYFFYLDSIANNNGEYKIIKSIPKEDNLVNRTIVVHGAKKENIWVAGRVLVNQIKPDQLVLTDWRFLKNEISTVEEITLFIHDSLPLSESGDLARGIVCGDRDAIPLDDRILFQHAGTMHLFAVSGLHVGCLFLLFDLVGKCLSLSLKMRGAVALLACGFYVILVGEPNSAVRAWLMLATFFCSLCLNRKNFSFSSLCLSAIIILAISPREIFSLGFQLSFTIVTIILWTFRGFPKKELHSSPLLYGTTALILCLACSVGSSLIVIDYFGYFSGLSIISNVLIYPIVFIFFALSVFCIFITNDIILFLLESFGSYIILVSSYFGTLNDQLFGNIRFPDIPNLMHFLFVCFFVVTFYLNFSFTMRLAFIAFCYSLVNFLCFYFS